jgi:exosortase
MTLNSIRTDRWTAWHALAAAFMAALGVAATFPAWADMYLIAYNDEEYSHIFLVPLVALWMVWVRRLRFRHCRTSGTVLGLVIAGLGWGISSYGFYHGHQSLWHGGSVLVVLGCVVTVLGKQLLFRFFPAVAVLVFLVPVPGMIRQQIAIPLQTWTAQISQVVLEVLGVPVERSVNQLTVNGIPVNIIEACNGLRMVWPLILMSYAFSFGLPLRNSVRFVVLAASPLAAIFCNVVRILPTIWLYSYHTKKVADLFHDYSGWLMLPIAFLILLGLIKTLRWAMIPVMRYTLAS